LFKEKKRERERERERGREGGREREGEKEREERDRKREKEGKLANGFGHVYSSMRAFAWSARDPDFLPLSQDMQTRVL
jgi:hypothetical protein